MPKLEAGKWPPYNVEALDQNIARVFFEEDIGKLNKPTYQFIIAHMGFIAHYDLRGFQGEYQDLDHFGPCSRRARVRRPELQLAAGPAIRERPGLRQVVWPGILSQRGRRHSEDCQTGQGPDRPAD